MIDFNGLGSEKRSLSHSCHFRSLVMNTSLMQDDHSSIWSRFSIWRLIALFSTFASREAPSLVDWISVRHSVDASKLESNAQVERSRVEK